MKKRPAKRLTISELVCTECSAKMYVPRSKNYREAGHIKTMYCWKCKKVTDHIEHRGIKWR